MQTRLNLDPAVVREARDLAARAGQPIVEMAKTHTTVSVERAVLRLAGLQGADPDGMPWVNRIVDAVRETTGLEHGVALPAFDALLTERRTRPSLLGPVWRVAAFALGAGTALLGEEAAHACTEAVEQVIEEHYAGQARELETSEPELAARISRFREEELVHQAEAVESGARRAVAYPLLAAVIRAGCRAAIKTAEKI